MAIIKDNTEMLQELFQAVDKIVDVRVQNLNFNKTVLCEVVEDSKASENKYVVTDSTTRFDAYSENDTYKKKDMVYVIIPNNNFDEQKTIVGKQAVYDKEITDYINSLEQFLKQTENILENENSKTFGIVANDSNNKEILIWEYTNIENPYRDFSMLGFSGEFKTNFYAYYNPLDNSFEQSAEDEYIEDDKPYRLASSGDYGLKLRLYENSDINAYSEIDLSSTMMYGDIYNFNFPIEQDINCNISNLSKIEKMELLLYQNNNFEDDLGRIEYSAAGFNIKNNPPKYNIEVSNLKLYLGIATSELTEGELIISSNIGSSYSKDNENPEKEILLEAKLFLSASEIIDSEDEFNKLNNAEIIWYKYKNEEWIEVEKSKTSLKHSSTINTNNKFEKYKVKIEIPANSFIDKYKQAYQELDGIKDNSDYKIFIKNVLNLNIDLKEKYDLELLDNGLLNEAITSLYSAVFDEENHYVSEVIIKNSEDITKLNTVEELWLEQIKFKKEEFKEYATLEPEIYESEIFTLINIDLINDTSNYNEKLKIYVDKDGNNGTYFLYDNKNKIITPAAASQKRKLYAEVSDSILSVNDFNAYWYIPMDNTMIESVDKTDKVKLIKIENGIHVFENDENGNYYKISKLEAEFTIKEYFNINYTNNKIYFQLENQGLIEELVENLAFGPKGSQGVEYNFILTPSENRPLKVCPEGDSIYLTAKLYDGVGREIELDDTEIKFSWESKNEDGDKIVFDGNKIIVSPEENENIELFERYIVKASTEKNINGRIVSLYAYYPLAVTIRSGEVLYYGASEIRYNDNGGSPEYYNDIHQLFINGIEEENILWNINTFDSLENERYYPRFYTEEKYKDEEGIEQSVKKFGRYLSVPSLFISNNNNNVCIETIKDEKVIFSYPLRSYQNIYNISVLNSWDGNLTIDEKNGTILSSKIGAGKKEIDNSFSGVFMGHIDETQDGLFGYHTGKQSFGFNIDGTAFLGRADEGGRIEFDGKSGVIKTNNYNFNNPNAQMQINLSNGSISCESAVSDPINAPGQRARVLLDPGSKLGLGLFLITNREGKPLFNIKEGATEAQDEFFLQSNSYATASGMSVVPREQEVEKPAWTEIIYKTVNITKETTVKKDDHLELEEYQELDEKYQNATYFTLIKEKVTDDDEDVHEYYRCEHTFTYNKIIGTEIVEDQRIEHKATKEKITYLEMVKEDGTDDGNGFKIDLKEGIIDAYSFNLNAAFKENGQTKGFLNIQTNSINNPIINLSYNNSTIFSLSTLNGVFVSSLNVNGASSFGATSFRSDINVIGTSSLKTTNVNGALTAYSAKINNNLTIGGSIGVGGGLTAASAVINGSTISYGLLSANGGLNVNNRIIITKSDPNLTTAYIQINGMYFAPKKYNKKYFLMKVNI